MKLHGPQLWKADNRASNDTSSGNYLDCVSVDPDHYKIEFENEKVRVIRVTFAAGETSPEHDHPARLTVFLRDYQTTNRLADGDIDRRSRFAGETEWRPAVRHIPHADVGFENIQVEIKNLASVDEGLPLPLDPVKLEPEHYTVDQENAFTRVLRIRYGPGEKSAIHRHAGGVIVFLTAFSGELLNNGRLVTQSAPAGAVAWLDVTSQIIRNSSEWELRAILIEVK